MTGRGLFAIAMLAIVACSRGEASPAAAEEVHRVVSLAPSMTEALFAVGAGDRVVGRSRFCDFPPEAAALPIVGDVHPDVEAILGLHPDLVVGIEGLTSARIAEPLRARGVRVWLPATNSLAAIDQVLLGLGARVAHLQDAKRVTAAIDAREQAIGRSVAGEPRPRVLLVVSQAPVVAAGPKSFADELIRSAGARNVLEEGGPWPTVGFERIVELDPDVVLDATVLGTEDPAHISSQTPGWNGVQAVREGHVVPIRDERVLRAGPRIAEGLAVLARALHPQVELP
jgi:iron complex transport system substrate-binding protein